MEETADHCTLTQKPDFLEGLTVLRVSFFVDLSLL